MIYERLALMRDLLSHFKRVKIPAFQAAASAFLFLYLWQLRCLWQYVVSTAFIKDFLIDEADIVSFSCYSNRGIPMMRALPGKTAANSDKPEIPGEYSYRAR
jgi:hypothetical protein